MATLNTSHHEATGGITIFNGELILLYCDGVNCDIDLKGSSKGRTYLTTHRLIFTSKPLNQNEYLKSFSAPFYAMFDLSLEQPIFGANYIKGKVTTADEGNYRFKLKFKEGGAIELGQAMLNASRIASQNARNFHAPPAYTPSAEAAASYYQAPDNVFQPSYPVGFVLPTQAFPEAPPAGFVYTSQAPPPYPGLTTVGSQENLHQRRSQNQQLPSPPGFAADFNTTYSNSSYPPAPSPSAGFIYNNPSAPGAQGAVPPTYAEATKKTQ